MKYWIIALLALSLSCQSLVEASETKAINDNYQLSKLIHVSNLNFEDVMYGCTKHVSHLKKVTFPGHFSSTSEVASFLVLNHIPLNVENTCGVDNDEQRKKADQDLLTLSKWEEKLINFDNMNDTDKELYLRLLNILFQKAKINHTGWDLPDLMAHTKLEKIVTTLSSFATRQLSIPNVNDDTQLKQLFETTERVVSKYNMQIITELAYMENLLMGTQPWVVDRGDGVFYAIPDMSQEFMDFLASVDAQGNQFITTEQINSLVDIVNQLNRELTIVTASEETTEVVEETTETSESVTDYAQLQEEYLSYFKNERVSKKYGKRLSKLPTDIQYTLLKSFQIWAEEIGWKDADEENKHFLVLRLFKIYEQVNKESGEAMTKVWNLIEDFPNLVWWKLERMVTLIAKQADHYEYEMSDEDKAELASLQAEIEQSDRNIAKYKQIIAQSDRNIAKDKQIIAQIDKLSSALTKKKKKGVGVKTTQTIE